MGETGEPFIDWAHKTDEMCSNKQTGHTRRVRCVPINKTDEMCSNKQK